MHREAGDHIEDILAGKPPAGAREHLTACAECREAISAMQDQSTLLRRLRPPADFDAEPRPGFYARVMERIEAQGPISIWNLFMESAFGRRVALASLALALLLGVYLVATEQAADEPLIAGDPTGQIFSPAGSPAGAPAASAAFQDAQPLNQVPLTVGPAGMDPFAAQMEQFVVEMNQFVNHMEPGAPEGEALVDLVTYREQ